MIPIESFHNNLAMSSMHKVGTLTFKSTTMKNIRTLFPLERQTWTTGPENENYLAFKVENNLVAYSMASTKAAHGGYSFSTTKLKSTIDIIQNLPKLPLRAISTPQGHRDINSTNKEPQRAKNHPIWPF